jgi:enoyl-[acyl-carrier protein] reductase I
MLLEGKKILVTGVLTPQSIAFEVARIAQQEGAEIVLSGYGKALALTQRSARRLPRTPEVLEMDVNDDDQIAAVAAHVRDSWGSLDGFLHAIAFAPEDALGGAFLDTPRSSAEIAFRTSAYSLKALTVGMLALLDEGGSVVSLDFDASVAWPIYDWMGVSKAALEAITRYLARDLGRKSIRVNCVSAGPLRTMAARSIPGFDQIASAWEGRAPLGWDPNDPRPVAQAVAFLLSDLSSGITGEIVHVDGGYHAMGAGLGERPD